MNGSFSEALAVFAGLLAAPLDRARLLAARGSASLREVCRADPFEGLPEQDDAATDALAEEATRLFERPVGQHPALEGLARGDDQLFGRHAREVRRKYLAAGFEPDEDSGLPHDHLAVELMFVSALLSDEELDRAAWFVSRHLLSWLPDWLAAFRQQASLPFYPVLVESLIACLGDLESALSETSDE